MIYEILEGQNRTDYERGVYYYLLGCALHKNKQYDDAINELNKALVFFKNDDKTVANVYYYKSLCYKYKKELLPALESMTLCIGNAEKYNVSECWLYLLKAQIYIGLGKLNEALNELRIAESIAGDEVDKYTSYLGDVYYYMKDYDSAFENYERALTINETRWQTYADRATLYLATGDTVSALKDFNMVYRNMRPVCNNEYHVYAIATYYSGHKKKAESAIKYVLNHIDKDGEMYDYNCVANYYAAIGDADMAFKYLKMTAESGYYALREKYYMHEWIVLMNKNPEIKDYIDTLLL